MGFVHGDSPPFPNAPMCSYMNKDRGDSERSL